MKNRTLISIGIAALLISGCDTNSYKPTDVQANRAQRVEAVVPGVVIQVTQVRIRSKKNSEAGQLLGGGLAGYGAYEALGNSGNATIALGTAAAALLGGYIGDKVAGTTVKQSLDLIIELDDGQAVSITQAFDESQYFETGQAVWVIGSGNQMRVVNRGLVGRPREY